MAAFLAEEDAPPDDTEGVVSTQVRHVAGSVIWSHYEAVRAYETIMDTVTIPQLHLLRITGKYLRYTLEFFSEVLPSEAGALIRDVVGMQDQLGNLHDADVAIALIQDYLAATQPRKAKRRAVESAPRPGRLSG